MESCGCHDFGAFFSRREVQQEELQCQSAQKEVCICEGSWKPLYETSFHDIPLCKVCRNLARSFFKGRTLVFEELFFTTYVFFTKLVDALVKDFISFDALFLGLLDTHESV